MNSHTPITASLGLLFATLVAGSAPAQTTWIVDVANGAGTHFTDLPPALAAAKDGDRILVRKGDYSVDSTSKALALIGEPGATLGRPQVAKTFVVQGLPKGRRFTIQGFAFAGASLPLGARYLLELQSCQGQVHLSDLKFASPSQRHASIYVGKCDSVTMRNCQAKPGLVVESSHVSCSNSTFTAFDWTQGPPAQGINCYASTLELTRCSAKGSDGSGHSPHLPAVRVLESTLVIRGDSSSRFVGGTFPGLPSADSLQDFGKNKLLLDPAVFLSPALKGFPTAVVRRLPAVTSTGGALGGSLKVTMQSPQGDLYLMLGSAPMPPLQLPGLGTTWMEAALLFLIASGLQGSTEVQQWTLQVPRMPALRGVPIALQAISGSSTRLELSNPSVPVLY